MQFRNFSILLVATFLVCSASLSSAHNAGGTLRHSRRLNGEEAAEGIAKVAESTGAAEKVAKAVGKESPEDLSGHELFIKNLARLDKKEQYAKSYELNKIFKKKSSTLKKILKWAGLGALSVAGLYGLYQYLMGGTSRQAPHEYPAAGGK